MVPVEWGLGARSLGDSPGEAFKLGALLFQPALLPLGLHLAPALTRLSPLPLGRGAPAGAVHRLLGLSITLAQADRVRRGWRLPGKAMRLGPWVNGESTASHTSQKFN